MESFTKNILIKLRLNFAKEKYQINFYLEIEFSLLLSRFTNFKPIISNQNSNDIFCKF